VKGLVAIHFVIRRDGTIEAADIVSSSGSSSFDIAAMKAVSSASPLPPLPADFPGDHEGVTVAFRYNMRPSEKAP